jgi:hypothetical protein
MLRFERDRCLGHPLSTLPSPRSHEISTPRSTRVHVSRVITVDSDFLAPSQLSPFGDVWNGSAADKKREQRITSIGEVI